LLQYRDEFEEGVVVLGGYGLKVQLDAIVGGGREDDILRQPVPDRVVGIKAEVRQRIIAQLGDNEVDSARPVARRSRSGTPTRSPKFPMDALK
jgi:hypothetical protein